MLLPHFLLWPPGPPLACPLLVRFPKRLEYQSRGWGACLPPMDPDQQSTSQTTPDTWDVRYVRKSEIDKNQCAQHKRGKTVQKNWIFYGLSRLKKQVHIIRAPLSRLCVSTCPMRLSYVCVHVSPAIQNFTNALFYWKDQVTKPLNSTSCLMNSGWNWGWVHGCFGLILYN